MICQCVSWFTWYCGTRSYSNSMEAALSVVAIWFWPFNDAPKAYIRNQPYARSLCSSLCVCVCVCVCVCAHPTYSLSHRTLLVSRANSLTLASYLPRQLTCCGTCYCRYRCGNSSNGRDHLGDSRWRTRLASLVSPLQACALVRYRTLVCGLHRSGSVCYHRSHWLWLLDVCAMELFPSQQYAIMRVCVCVCLWSACLLLWC
jgi:hypothetical protein